MRRDGARTAIVVLQRRSSIPPSSIFEIARLAEERDERSGLVTAPEVGSISNRPANVQNRNGEGSRRKQIRSGCGTRFRECSARWTTRAHLWLLIIYSQREPDSPNLSEVLLQWLFEFHSEVVRLPSHEHVKLADHQEI